MAIAPFQQDFSGQCDATGAGTLIVQGPTGHWSAVYLPIEVSSGTPSWTLREGAGATGLPIVYGFGTQTMLGPIILRPGQVFTAVVKGATANATVLGRMLGWIADYPSELPAALPSPASVAISGGTVNATIQGTPAVSISGTPTVQFAAGQQVNIGTITGTVNIQGVTGGVNVGTIAAQKVVDGPFSTAVAVTHNNIAIPAGSNGLLILESAANGSITSVVGTQSGFSYPVLSNVQGNNQMFLIPLSAADTSLSITYNPGLATITFTAIALIGSEAGYLLNSPKVRIQDAFGNDIASGPAQFGAPGGALSTTQQYATAGVWQSPNKVPAPVAVNIAALGTAVIIAGVAGQTVRLFGVHLAIDTPVATGEVVLQDTTAVAIHSFSVGVTVCNPFDGAGLALPVGRGVQLTNNMGANPAVMRGSIVYSQ